MNTASSPPLISAMRGRLWLAGGLLALGGTALWMPSPMARAAGALLLGLSLLLAVFSLRCPSCGVSLFWHAVSQHPIGRWLSWLLDVRECPVCHYRIDTST
ncbi:hypothetical protein ACS5PN_25835 [Roseateles sp. NT4]|uniref:hypothetical protein n=1 Tax=Roseateles sp. NT4 TaxID=3453715 RepID=UPI003EF0887D